MLPVHFAKMGPCEDNFAYIELPGQLFANMKENHPKGVSDELTPGNQNNRILPWKQLVCWVYQVFKADGPLQYSCICNLA